MNMTVGTSGTRWLNPVYLHIGYGISGCTGNAANPLTSALAPNAGNPSTTDGRKMTQSKSRAASTSSPRSFVLENCVGCSRLTPIAEK